MRDDAELELFLSHGPADREFVEEFTLLLAGTVRLERDQIGCTAIPDSVAEPSAPRMRLGIFSPSSLRSGTVMSELGPIAESQTILVLLHGLEPSALPARLRGFAVHRAYHEPELDALFERLGREFGEKDPSEGRLLPSERQRRMARLVELGTLPAPARDTRRRRRPTLWLASVAALAGISVAGWAAHRAASSPGTYGFEQGAEGWTTSGGCIAARPSQDRTKSGQFALALGMALGPAQQQGEAWVDMRKSRPAGVSDVPVNLGGRTVTAWVYAPRGAAGDAKRPNGFQLFVKDDQWRAAYGSWQNVVEERWVRITLAVGAAQPPSGFVAAGFDPTRVIAVGVKFGLGGDRAAGFEGSVYLDAVDW
jgi:hypothetical protein